MRLFSLIGSTQFVSPTYLSWMIDSGRCTDCFQIGFSVKKLNEKSTFKQPSEIWYQETNFDSSSSQMNHKLLEGCYQSYLIRVWCGISKNFAIHNPNFCFGQTKTQFSHMVWGSMFHDQSRLFKTSQWHCILLNKSGIFFHHWFMNRFYSDQRLTVVTCIESVDSNISAFSQSLITQ